MNPAADVSRRSPFGGTFKVMHSSRFRLASAVLLCAALAGCGSDDSSSSGDAAPLLLSASLDSFCVQSINGYRATLSLPALTIWSDSQSCFARQARDDAASGTAHSHFGACTERAQNTCPGWNSADDDSSRRVVVRNCLAMMWNEGPGSDYSKHGHYINMVNASYTKVGCGFHQGDGTLWVNMDFR